MTRSGSSIELFEGLGLTTLGLGGNYETPMPIDNGMEVANTYMSLYYDRPIDGFAIAGILLEIPYEIFTLKPFVSYSFSPFSNAAYTIEPQNTNSILNQSVNSWRFTSATLKWAFPCSSNLEVTCSTFVLLPVGGIHNDCDLCQH